MANSELENFIKTLAQLKAYLVEPVLTDRDRSGVIHAFEFTFEQCWKSLQKLAARTGGQVGNAKQAFVYAMQSGWIDRAQETHWLRILEDRNLTSHTYKMELAEQVLQRVQRQYVVMFEELLEKLKAE